MPLPIVGGFFAWLVGLFGTTFTAFCTWLMTRLIYEKAVQYALITAFLVAAAALTITISLSIKAAVLAAQVAMPSTLGMATYFLPSNINQIFGLIVTIRVSTALYRWTIATMAAYTPTKYSGSNYAF